MSRFLKGLFDPTYETARFKRAFCSNLDQATDSQRAK
jgi:hypothetical protein